MWIWQEKSDWILLCCSFLSVIPFDENGVVKSVALLNEIQIVGMLCKMEDFSLLWSFDASYFGIEIQINWAEHVSKPMLFTVSHVQCHHTILERIDEIKCVEHAKKKRFVPHAYRRQLSRHF